MRTIKSYTAGMFASLALLAMSVSSQGQGTNMVIDRFDPGGPFGTNGYSSGGISNIWGNWFGGAYTGVDWDGTMDADTNPASGSLKITANFGNQIVIWDQGGYGTNNFWPIIARILGNTSQGLNGYQYTNFQCDIRIEAGSATTVNGSTTNYGHLTFGSRTPDYQRTYFGGQGSGGLEVPVGSNNWIRVNRPINPVVFAEQTNIWDININLYGPWYTPALSGPWTMWVDNILFQGGTNTAPTGRAEVGKLQPAVHALRTFAGDASATYMRQNIATVSDVVSWYENVNGPTYPFTYSITITNFPNLSLQGYEYHMFLIPSAALPYAQYANSFADWDTTNLVSLRIVANTSNVVGILSYKVNLPGAAPDVTLATISNTNAVGTWTLSFSDNTNGTLTKGTNTASFTIPMADAAKFANPLVAYFGVQPNSTNGYYQGVDVSRIQITGLLNDNFSAPGSFSLDTGAWTVVASVPASVWLAEPGAKYWLNWSVPEDIYLPLVNTNLSTGSGWLDPAVYNGGTPLTKALIGARRYALILSNNLPPGAKNVFFAVRKP